MRKTLLTLSLAIVGVSAELASARAGPSSAAVVPATTSISPLAGLNWLAGCWQGMSGASTFREHWMPAAGNLMMGMSRTTRGDKVVATETIRIEVDADGATPVYVPNPSGQKEARFKLLAASARKWTFENLANDFPQRIIYQHTASGDLFARIDGVRGGVSSGQAMRAIDYPMKRVNCESMD